MIYDTKHYTLSKLDENTYYLWDLSGRIPQPFYYKTLKAAERKIASIMKGVK